MKAITRQIVIDGKEYTARYSMRALFLYERMTGNNGFEVKGTEDTFRFLYCMILAGTPNCDLSWDEFIDACDENMTIAEEITKLITEQVNDADVMTTDEPATDGGVETAKKK